MKRRRLEIKSIFRVGNKLMDKAIKAETNPLGDIFRSVSIFLEWVDSITENERDCKIAEYFYKTYNRLRKIELEKYDKPVLKSFDGELLSHRDMDRIMMIDSI